MEQIQEKKNGQKGTRFSTSKWSHQAAFDHGVLTNSRILANN